MTYKSLFSVLTGAGEVDEVLPFAADITARFDGHLDVLCLGVDHSQTGFDYAGSAAVILQQTIDEARTDAEALHRQSTALLTKTDSRWGVERDITRTADLTRVVARRARFADLAILPQPYGENRSADIATTVEACLFDANLPVLIAPTAADTAPADSALDAEAVTKPRHIAIAWNDSAEAMRAIRAAMPLLRLSDTVHIVIIDPPAHGPDRSDPGGMLAQFLARHGLRVEVDVLSRTLPRVSDVLIRHAADIDASMIVMGAYGHSRFREAVFGGATREMLEQAQVPVLMAR